MTTTTIIITAAILTALTVMSPLGKHVRPALVNYWAYLRLQAKMNRAVTNLKKAVADLDSTIEERTAALEQYLSEVHAAKAKLDECVARTEATRKSIEVKHGF
jgi:uncharacterized protein YlxW (UPF0749 family)